MWFVINNVVSPKRFFNLSMTLLPWFSVLFIILFSYGLIAGLFIAPADYLQGDGFRIIYVHVPCAFLSLFIYSIMALAAFSALVWRLKLAFMVIRYSASLGAGFTALDLF